MDEGCCHPGSFFMVLQGYRLIQLWESWFIHLLLFLQLLRNEDVVLGWPEFGNIRNFINCISFGQIVNNHGFVFRGRRLVFFIGGDIVFPLYFVFTLFVIFY